MDRRDNELFDKDIKGELMNDDIKIPDSLRPESIEKRIALMTPEEMKRRKNSVDVPYQNSESTQKTEKKKNDIRVKRVVLPIVLAAALILMFGLGLKVGRGRLKSGDAAFEKDSYNDAVAETDSADTAAEAAEESMDAAVTADAEKEAAEEEEKDEKKSFFKKKTDNYDKAYEVLKACADYAQNDYILEYDAASDDVFLNDSAVRKFSSATEATTQAAVTQSSDTIDILSGEMVSAPGIATNQKDESATVPEFTDTNVRTQGVAESDIVKTDGNFIYSYDYDTEHIYIYRVKDGSMNEVGYINVLSAEISNAEMYVSGDRLILVGWDESYEDGSRLKTAIVIYDIKDRTNPDMLKRITQDGTYYSSRLVGDYLYTFSQKYVPLDKLSKRKYETFIPEIDGDLVENDNIYVQDDSFVDSYVVISAVDLNKGKIKDRFGLLAGSDNLYVSTENIYLTDRKFRWNVFSYDNDTNVAKISYKNGKLKFECKGTIPGYIKDDYCIDEHNGYLRTVTTYYEDYDEVNGLFVYDENLKKVSVIKGLAKNETIKSARFMGDTAYFVTFRQTDPLFAVDLSDPENPKITDYLKIPGFSAYLHPYSDGKLLGIGYDADENTGRTQGLKLTMFDVSDPTDVQELDTMHLDNYDEANVLSDRKALMFDDRDGLFGFGLTRYYLWSWQTDDGEDAKSFYNIYDYDEDKGFVTKLEYGLYNSGLSSYSPADIYNTRGLIIGDYFYLVQDGDKLTSFDTDKFEVVKELN